MDVFNNVKEAFFTFLGVCFFISLFALMSYGMFSGISNYANNIRKNESYVYISSFAVFPSKRGGGTGKKCWNLAMEYFKNMNFEQNNAIIKGFLLLVNELWTKALTIYEKSGFEKIKTFKNFFDNGEKSFSDGILMKLDL